MASRTHVAVTKLDFVAVPSQDAERSRAFYDVMLHCRYAPYEDDRAAG